MAGRFLDLLGTSYGKLQVGIDAAALNLKAVAGKFRARNKADSADVPVVGSVIAASGDFLELNEDAVGAAADWKYTLARPAAGMTANRTIVLPPDAGTPGFAVVTDGAGNWSYVAVAAGNDKIITDTTTLAFGSVSPLAMFNLPATAVIDEVKVVIDTPFNGTPSLSIGIAGTVSKYLSATQVDLTQAAGTSCEVDPALASAAGIEAMIATYAAGGATAGSARLLVSYSIPS